MKKLFFIYLFSISLSFAQPAGSFDTTYGTNGKVSHCLTPGLFFPVFTIQSTGKIVCTAQTDNISTPFVSKRLNTNGTLDSSFSSSGLAALTPQAYIYSITAQTDDKILVVGSWTETNGHKDFLIARLQANGDIDTSFGINGILQLDLGSVFDTAYAVAVTANGKILVGGTAGSVDGGFCLARLNTNGTLDTTFGTNGITITVFTAGGESEIKALRLLPDGKILTVGERVDQNFAKNIAMARYLVNGTLDTTFGTNGKVATAVSSIINDIFHDVEIAPDGKIVALVNHNPSSGLGSDGMALLRFLANGTLDSSFGTSGISNHVSEQWGASNIYIQNDNKIVCAGNSWASYFFKIIRLNVDGTTDTTFGTNGYVDYEFGNDNERALSIFNSPTGKMTACGISELSAGCVGCIRLNEGVLSNEAFDKNNFILYPNPTNDVIAIQNLNQEYKYELYSITGFCVQKGIVDITNNNLNIENLNSGVYLLQMKNKEGNLISYKLIKN